MESKEFQSVEASRGAGSTDKGKDKIESGSAMRSPDPKSPLVAGSSNATILGSADTGNVKVTMETTSLESAGLAVGEDLKDTINSLGSSNNQDREMGAMSLAKKRPSRRAKEKRKKKSANKQGFKNAVEPRRYESPSDKEPRTTPEEEYDAAEKIEDLFEAYWRSLPPLTYIPDSHMDPELYKAATTGNVDAFAGAVGDPELTLSEKVTPRGNSVLHLAASFGNASIVNFILENFPKLVELENQKGDLALHVAASAGHLTVIKSLVSCAQNDDGSLLHKMNQQGNTPLHVALENGQQETALHLVQADRQVSYRPNREGKSPFYMAAKSGYLEIVEHITTEDPSRLDSHNQGELTEQNADAKHDYVKHENQGKIAEKEAGSAKHDSVEHGERKAYKLLYPPDGCQLLHASIIGRNEGVMNRIWHVDSSLIYSTDEEGRTPLSLAASIGYLDGVRYILGRSVDSTYQRDRTGFFPIHWACARGHIEIIDEFLSRCPDSLELLNKQGENILHVAAKNGRAKLVSWMLKLRELDMLINEKDENGFTPLHWATSNCHPKVVGTLTWDKRVKLEITNNEGLTALDIAEKHTIPDGPFRGRLTRAALKSANAPRSEKAKTWREMTMASGIHEFKGGQDRQRVNTLVLVATLVATVTFACGFTLPGGINNSNPNAGMATMVTKGAFQAFLICNTTALYSSILVAVTLIWAQLGDLYLIRNTFRIAVPLLGMALIAMSSAFISGVYLVVSNNQWLAILILIMGSISVVILSVVFFFLYFPLSSKSRIGRYLMYYPIELMMLVTGSDIESDTERAITEELPSMPLMVYKVSNDHMRDKEFPARPPMHYQVFNEEPSGCNVM